MPTNPTIFVSHSHLDNEWCREFVATLQASGLNVWYDEKGLQAGAAWVKVIQTELQARDIFLLVLTPNAWASEWVQDEIQLALATRRRIIVVEHLPTQVDGFLITRQWIKVIGMSTQAAGQLVSSTLVTTTDRRDPPPPPPNDRDEIGIPESLYRLGYRGWRIRRTGVSYIEPPTCPVTAGMFVMGSAESDSQASSNEKPQYRIPVAAFSIAKFPLTVAEYSYYVKANPGKQDLLPASYTFPKDTEWCAPEWRGKELSWAAQQTRPDHPVVNITWFNAWDYAAWLGATTSQPWSLPTEAEWEKAARWDEAKQVSRMYPWGDAFDPSRANTADERGKARPGLGKTTPVGSYPSSASPCGAQDMAGNVWEWCSSLYKGQYPYDAAVSEDDGNNRTDVCVLRGGSWLNLPGLARAAFRGRYTPDFWNLNSGARVCLRAVGT